MVAFHDYLDDFPGVKQFVNEVLQENEFQFVAQRDRFIILKNTVLDMDFDV